MIRKATGVFLFLLAAGVSFHLAAAGHAHAQWKSIARGVEYARFNVNPSAGTGNGEIHVVRIDPAKARLKLLLASEHDRKNRTTAEWCGEFHLIAAINAGMFLKDYLTNVGYLRNGSHVQNRRWNRKYKSVLAFDPQKTELPPAVMIDLDEPSAMQKAAGYRAVVQNLRLMKDGGVNVWEASEKKWSEAAVGMDGKGRVLFLFCRFPFPMKEFNERIKALALDVTRLMHMEGGPVASLSIRTKDVYLDLSGSYETFLQENDLNLQQWPIPNVIGVQAR
jgi:hypothetical protein